MPAPNFLVIGAARCGTTALTRFLGQHPEVFICDPKEPHFLSLAGRQPDFQGPGDDITINSRAVTRASDYFRLFDRANGKIAIGEGSVSTLYYHRESIVNIRTYLPRVKLIAIFRDPVERAYSAFMYMTARGREPLRSFAEGLDAEPERVRQRWQHIWHYTRMGFYCEQVEAFRAAFGEDRLLVLTSDDLKNEPRETLAKAFDFLGVDTSFRPKTHQAINSSGRPRSRAVAAVTNVVSRSRTLRNLAYRAMPMEAVHALRKLNLRRPEMTLECRERLARIYRPEVEKLELIIQRDLSSWKAH